MPVSSRAEQVFDRLASLYGGTAVTVQAAPTGTSNTKAVSADDCVRKDHLRAIESGLDRDTCSFLVRASAFESGFTASNPVVPVAGMTFTVLGESVWYAQSVSSICGVVFVFRCVGA